MRIQTLFNKCQLILLAASLGLLAGCDTSTERHSSLLFSMDSYFKQHGSGKPSARSSHGVSSITLQIRKISGELLTEGRLDAEVSSKAFTVPSSVELHILANGFDGDIKTYAGEVAVAPLIPGESRQVSFHMYSVDLQPITIDVGLNNQPANGPSAGAKLSLSRNYFLFTSDASNLTEGDKNESTDVFLRDLDTGSILNLHTNAEGKAVSSSGLIAESNDISVDGRYAVFSSSSSDLVENDNNGVFDVFIKDTLSGFIQRISVSNTGQEFTLPSYSPDITNDGRYVLFYSEADLLGTGGNRYFRYDRIADTLTSSVQNARQATLSGDGAFIIYVDSTSGSLKSFSSNDGSIIDILATEQVNRKSKLAKVQTSAIEFAVNRDGSAIVFSLHANRTPFVRDEVYLFRRSSGTITRISENASGEAIRVIDAGLHYPGISDDGRFGVFRIDHTIYVKFFETGELVAVANGDRPILSPDGARIGYTSDFGRLYLVPNPLYSIAVNVTPTNTRSPAPQNVQVRSQNGGVSIHWDETGAHTYYRVYLANVRGVTPDNYLELEGGAQFETLENSLSVPLDEEHRRRIYVVVTPVDDEGEGEPSDEAELHYLVSTSAVTNGTITPSSHSDVEQGSHVAFNITPATGYHIGNVTGCSGSLENGVYTTGPITADCPVTAIFEINRFSLNYTAQANGVLQGDTEQTVNYGSSGSIVTAVPNVGYSFVNWSDGSVLNPRTDINVTSNINVSAFFSDNVYSLTYAAGVNGALAVGTNQISTFTQNVVHGGNSVQVTAVPNTGYHFTNWSDGSIQSSRTDLNVTGNINVSANFAINTYTLSYSAGPNGTLRANDSQGLTFSQTVNYGSDGFAVRAAPGPGYHFVNWSDGSIQNPRTDTNVTGNVTVTAIFAIDTFTLKYTDDGNGTIQGNANQTVDYGTSGSEVEAVPNTGYHFTSWSDESTQNPRTDLNVTGNIDVTANFVINTYTLNYTAGANGTLSVNETQTPTYAQTVNYSSSGSAITAVPSTGYHFVDWSDGSTQNPRTDTNVTGNITVTANFAINTYNLSYTAGANGMLGIAVAQVQTYSQTVDYGASGDTITAVPNTGYSFDSWSDGLLTASRTDTNVTADINVQANFVADVSPFTALNDTGLVSCSDGVNFVSCPQTLYPGQDAEYGRDANSTRNDNDGYAGFSFTKLDQNGNALAATATSWACVRDNTTGLVWEVKTSTNSSTEFSWPDAQTYASNLSLCGFSDWRLPTVNELLSLVDYHVSNPAIDTNFFPYTISNYYWTIRESSQTSGVIWVVRFSDGIAGPDSPNYFGFPVRAVRGQ
ncbi:MAG: DUF1566 domain-containing protein [Gammaproteobacteria bacterium]|nr:DUF1566 domain-containing protein [Gammaproteobacteria bacterium]